MEFIEYGLRRGNFIISRDRIRELFGNLENQDKLRICFNDKKLIYKRIEGAVFCAHYWDKRFSIEIYENETLDDAIKEKFETEISPKIEEYIKNATPNEEFLVKYINGELVLKRKNL